MLGKLVSFAVGFYVGAYADQYYSLPKIPGPMGLYEKIKVELEKYKKEKPGPGKS